MLNMQTSANGLSALIKEEGIVLYAYDDLRPAAGPIMPGDPVTGTLTIGAGHTGPDVVPGMTITDEQARQLLADDVQWAEQRVNTSVNVQLSQPQFDALVSHTFNTGGSEELFSFINQGKPESEIKHSWTSRYIWSNGVFLQGLQDRRNREWELYATGIYPGQKKN